MIGLPTEDLGRRVHAIVEIEGEVTDAELLGHLVEGLASNQPPKTFEA